MSDARAAVEAGALKDKLEEDPSLKFIWLAADWNLADGFAKKKAESLRGLRSFLNKRFWRLEFDPGFVVSAKKAKAAQRAAVAMENSKPLLPVNLAIRSSRLEKIFGLMQEKSKSSLNSILSRRTKPDRVVCRYM